MTKPVTLTKGQAPAQQPVRGELLPANPAVAPAVLDTGLAQLAKVIDGTARSYAAAIEQATGHMERSFIMARGIQALRQVIDEKAMEPIMALMNSENGFKCDRPNKHSKETYPVSVVKECLITALLRGLYPINNEWNIIAGNCMTVQNGWYRKLREVPGISDISVTPGLPRNVDGVVAVRVAVSWRLDGKANQLTNEKGEPGPAFAVGSGGTDALIGKALRRAYKAAYEKATGSICTEEDTEPVEPAAALPAPGNAQSRTQQVLGSLAGAAPATRAAPAGSPEWQTSVEQIKLLFDDLELAEPEWYEIAERLGVPGKVQSLSLEQCRTVLDFLEGEQARLRQQG